MSVIKLTKLTESSFDKYNNDIIFQDDVSNRCYAIIEDEKFVFRLAWHSDLIEPVISELSEKIISIGIDQNFAIVDFGTGTISLKIRLPYNFLDARVFNQWVFVITELEILCIDKQHFQILNEFPLPEFFEEMQFETTHIIVKCAENVTVKFSVVN